jgi:N utilization substance protein A
MQETKMATGISANKLELVQIADAVAREKGIDIEIVLAAMADAIQKAAKARYGAENDIRVEINPKTGETRLLRAVEVVELVENDDTQISLAIAQRENPEAQIGDEIIDELPPVEFGRIATQAAKQVIVQRVREAEREQQFEEFKDRVGEIINGVVKRVEYGNVVLDLGRGEAVVRRDNLIPREVFRPGDRIRAYIQNVRREMRGPQIILSRSDPAFMAKLFGQEVPEIYDGVIEIRAVARDPGSRAKIAVISSDPGIDPVGACVGMRGSRVQAVVNELQGEKVDIIPWSEDAAAFIVNALAPAEVSKVVLDEDIQRIEVVVPDEQLSLAIGRRGQNVRLASQLTGWDIDIMTEAQESERRQAEFAERTETFMGALDVDEMIAQLLASEGFATVEEVAFVPLDEITYIEGFDDETAQEIQNRARDFLDQQNAALTEQRREMGVEDALAEITELTPAMLVRLGENDVKTLEDFAGCVTDDLTGWFETVERKRVRQDGILDGFDISPEEAEALIMSARVKAGWVTQEELDALAAEKAAAEAAAQAEELAAAEGLEGDEVLAGLETSSDSASDAPTEASAEAPTEASTPDTDAAL